MANSLETAAIKFSEERYDGQYSMSITSFKSGAKWQKEQSSWISVKDDLPPERVNVLVRSEYEGENCFEVAFMMNGKWVIHNSKPTHWMPIPE